MCPLGITFIDIRDERDGSDSSSGDDDWSDSNRSYSPMPPNQDHGGLRQGLILDCVWKQGANEWQINQSHEWPRCTQENYKNELYPYYRKLEVPEPAPH